MAMTIYNSTPVGCCCHVHSASDGLGNNWHAVYYDAESRYLTNWLAYYDDAIDEAKKISLCTQGPDPGPGPGPEPEPNNNGGTSPILLIALAIGAYFLMGGMKK